MNDLLIFRARLCIISSRLHPEQPSESTFYSTNLADSQCRGSFCLVRSFYQSEVFFHRPIASPTNPQDNIPQESQRGLTTRPQSNSAQMQQTRNLDSTPHQNNAMHQQNTIRPESCPRMQKTQKNALEKRNVNNARAAAAAHRHNNQWTAGDDSSPRPGISSSEISRLRYTFQWPVPAVQLAVDSVRLTAKHAGSPRGLSRGRLATPQPLFLIRTARLASQHWNLIGVHGLCVRESAVSSATRRGRPQVKKSLRSDDSAGGPPVRTSLEMFTHLGSDGLRCDGLTAAAARNVSRLQFCTKLHRNPNCGGLSASLAT